MVGSPRDRTSQPEQASPRRGFAAIVPLGRFFAVGHRDALMLFGTTVLLVGVGLIMVLSASAVEEQAASGDPFNRVMRQAVFAALGLPMMLIASRAPITFWKRWAWPAILVGIGLQLLVFVPGIGFGYGGNQNWIQIGDFTLQPSEFVKLALIVWIASILAPRIGELGDLRRLMMPVVPIAGAAIGLVLLGKDLGTVLIMVLIVFACAFFAGARLWHLLVGGLLMTIVAILVAMTSSSRVSRITSFLQGCDSSDYAGTCWQVYQGMFALANGGIFGVGLGNSHAKWNWLPEADSDYIFAIIGEELGLIGCAVVLGIFVILAITLARILRRAEDPFARIVTGGVLVWVVGQAFVNIAVVLGLLPVLGVPLPLISAGGSSLLAVLIALGVVMSFTRSRPSAAQVAARSRATTAHQSVRGTRGR
ncbi:MAG TPA: putative lipid II flippase FtsW [Microbacteriaceae bacterium]|nr:putative lipid II flippase FtsW [Microbacteriaceae bacterium]